MDVLSHSRPENSEIKLKVDFEKIKWVGNNWPNIVEQLHFGQCLGQGSFAKVYEGIDKVSKIQVAIKVIGKRKMKDSKRRELVEKELEVLSNLAHKNLMAFHRLLEDHKRVSLLVAYIYRCSLSLSSAGG